MGGKIGVLVEVNCETDFSAKTEDFTDFSKNLAMHIAAMSPIAISPEDVPEKILEQEKEIYRDQAIKSGKPENVAEKIVTGKMEKFYEENCVLEQAFVKDTNVTIGELIKQKIALLGENINIGRFSRFEI